MVSLFQFVSNTIGAVLCARKDQRAVEVRPLQQRHEQIEFLFGGDGVNGVRDSFGGRTAHANFHQLGIAQHPGSQPLDLRWQRRRKKQRLPIGRDFLNDPANIGKKAHVEHAIDFIEHKNIHLAQIHRALFEQIEQSTRRRDENIDTAFDLFALFSITNAAVHDGRAQIGEAAVIAKRCLDLRSQFARRLQHKTTKRAVFREQRQDRKGERRRFAGAGLRGADQIFARENNRKRAQLDRRRLGETHRLRAAHDFRQKSEIIK